MKKDRCVYTRHPDWLHNIHSHLDNSASIKKYITVNTEQYSNIKLLFFTLYPMCWTLVLSSLMS